MAITCIRGSTGQQQRGHCLNVSQMGGEVERCLTVAIARIRKDGRGQCSVDRGNIAHDHGLV